MKSDLFWYILWALLLFMSYIIIGLYYGPDDFVDPDMFYPFIIIGSISSGFFLIYLLKIPFIKIKRKFLNKYRRHL